ncbi:MAG TPA: modification methylase [Rikenellaceae bacterium]|nr:modification methylase [Rikenellaceae bacterium]
MNYIGSKFSLLPFLESTIEDVVGTDLHDKVFCDIFAGTGIVGRLFKSRVRRVIANDWEYYSYVLNRNYIGNHLELDGKDDLLNRLNQLEGDDNGFIFRNYCVGSGSGRQYFSDENGKKIDAIRIQIEEWKTSSYISEDMYFFLLASLLESSDKLANTASVYGSFLKHLKTTAQKPLSLTPATYTINENEHDVYCLDANVLIKKIEGDILYLDPPYNARQYGANYHLLNTIAEYKPFLPKGKTGLRQYLKSLYCGKKSVLSSFRALIQDAKFKYIVMSYNNEGLMSPEDIESVMSQYGHYDRVSKDYQRYRADKEDSRNHLADRTIEYLHILEKT